jgi:hypothetical protein
MKLRFLAVAFAATFMLAAVTSQAAVPFNSPQPLVYAQNSDFNGAISSQNDTTGGNGLFAQAWDNFTLGTNTSIEEVQWIGSYFNPPNQGVITGFTVQFWSDSGGQPGVMLQDNFTATNANEQSLGLDNAGDPTFLYGLNLSTAFSASANTQYWLSVYPDLGFPPQWGWETGTGGDGASWQCFVGACGPIGNDLAFALFGTQGTGTPEPGTLVLLGTGILGLAGSIRRKLF